ncbi:MAG: T9SS type A sorting domain-containing protein [Bacteroidetes bacterium]|nr:T9SS type A sorting domain-containing protein [Bacteroidota bacterium]
MKKLLLILIVYPLFSSAQNKSGYSWVFGLNGQIANFAGDTSRPLTSQLFWNGISPNYPYIFSFGHSNISDRISGNLKFLCNGMQLFDTLGNIIENGDSLVPEQIYLKNLYPNAPFTQGSIILPKDTDDTYYLIIPTVSDSAYNFYWTNTVGIKFPYDEILFHVVDMKANGGMGKVISKNNILISNVELSTTMMQACRHSNGRDWWLLKQGLNTNIIYRFLVTKDSIKGPYVQNFAEPDFGFYEGTGQSCFSNDGKKYAALKGKINKLFLADFDRCTGELSHEKVLNIPIDSTSVPSPLPQYIWDSLTNGVCFSPNNSLLYITRRYNIYQLEISEPDSSLAWINIKHGMDTTYDAFEYYGQLALGPDQRIYIGKGGGGFKQLSVIDKPDEKGTACSFCRKCLRIDSGAGGSTSPPNMPDYTLGADTTSLCWPLQSGNVRAESEEWSVYPNPSYQTIFIKNAKGKRKKLFDVSGQIIYSTIKDEIDLSHYTKGMYFIKIENVMKKIIIE